MSKMDMYLITYMLDQTFDTVGNIIAEAYSVDDIEDNIMQLLMDAGLDIATADCIESEHTYFVQPLDDLLHHLVSVQY